VSSAGGARIWCSGSCRNSASRSMRHGCELKALGFAKLSAGITTILRGHECQTPVGQRFAYDAVWGLRKNVATVGARSTAASFPGRRERGHSGGWL
jgi:hypothetical protein